MDDRLALRFAIALVLLAMLPAIYACLGDLVVELLERMRRQ